MRSLGDELMAAALIDRLVHHCHIVNIRGNGFRLRQHAELARRLHLLPDPTPHSASPPPGGPRPIGLPPPNLWDIFTRYLRGHFRPSLTPLKPMPAATIATASPAASRWTICNRPAGGNLTNL